MALRAVSASTSRPSDAFTKLGLLHLDHEQDVVVTCDLWKRAMPSSPIAWDDGVDGGLLCHLLFSVTANATRGRAMLRFRCGPGASRGHKLNMPHYETLVDVALTKPDELTTLNSRRQRVHAQVGIEPEEHEFGQPC